MSSSRARTASTRVRAASPAPFSSQAEQGGGSEQEGGRKRGGFGLVRSATEFQCLVALHSVVALVVAALVWTRGAAGGVGAAPPLRLLREVLAGGIAAAAAEMVFFPLEVVKVRLQTSPAARARLGVLGTAAAIWRAEGPAGLWGSKGIVAGQLRALVYQGLRLGCFPTLKRLLLAACSGAGAADAGGSGGGGAATLGARVLAGLATGVLGAAVTSPLDLAKVVMTAEATRGEFSNSFDALFALASGGGHRSHLRVSQPPPLSPAGSTSGASLSSGGSGGLGEGSRRGLLGAGRGLAMARAAAASGAQLTAYDCAKAVAAAVALPGGRATLVVMSVIATAIIGLEVNEKLVPLFLG